MASPSQPDGLASPPQSNAAGWLEQAETVLGRKLTSIDLVGGIYCSICQSTFGNKKDYDSHYVDHDIGDADIGYTCVVCRKQFTGYPSFRNHCYLIHVARNKHKCIHCSKTFSKQSVLNSHIDTTHNFKCEPCQKQFPSKKELHIHQIIHGKDKPPYPCQECGETIDSIDMCEYHIDEHCTALYSCPICNDETTNNKLDAAKHLTKHFGEVLTDEYVSDSKIGEDCSIDILGGVLCNYCDELFKNRIEFDTHFTTEHGDQPLVYSCNICGKQYDKYHLFGDHCYNHMTKGRFECTDCGKSFPRLSLLVTHTEAYHSSVAVEKPFLCGECGRGFKSPNRLREHTRVVHETSTMRCTEDGCDMLFESLKELLLHQRSHRSCRENWCRQCGLQFVSLASCERHLDVHRKKHYACPVCRRTYREKYLILKHIPSHFECVLHVCKVCGKVFNLRSRLVQHSKTHSDLRAHKCNVCNKGFMKASMLQQHLNIHTGFRPYKCTECSKTFASYPNWHKHMRRMHNIEKQDKKDKNNKTIIAPELLSPPPVTVINKHDTKMNIESGIDSTSSEISLETYCFVESDDSTMDSIDPSVIEKDWCISNENSILDDSLQEKDWCISNENSILDDSLQEKDWCISNENSILDNSLQYTDMLPVNNTTFDFEVSHHQEHAVSSQPTGVPREYGPEFNVCALADAPGGACIDLDDHYLPHIDPLLTIRRDHFVTPPAPAWEPLITKVYNDTELNRLSIINTDIY